MEIEALKNKEGKLLCQECNVNPVVGECDDPRKWLCKNCMEMAYLDSDGDAIKDNSLVFCSAEWERQPQGDV